MATEIFSYANGGLITVVLEAPSTTSQVIAESPSFASDKYASYGTPSVYVNTAPTTTTTATTTKKPTTTVWPFPISSTSTGSRSRSQDINQHQVDPSTLLLSGFRSTSIYTTLTPGQSGTWVHADVGSYTTLGRTLPTTVLLGITTLIVSPTATILTTDMYGSPYNQTLYDLPSTSSGGSSGLPSAVTVTGYVGSGQSNNNNDGSTPSTATLAGTVGGMLALTVIAIVVGLLYWRRRRRIRRREATTAVHSGYGHGREKPARTLVSADSSSSLGAAPSYRAATITTTTTASSSTRPTTTQPSVLGWDVDSSDEGHESLGSSAAVAATTTTGMRSVGGRPYATLSSERLMTGAEGGGLETIVESGPSDSRSRSAVSVISPISPSVSVGFGPNRADPGHVRPPPPQSTSTAANQPHLRRHVTTGTRVGRAVENRPEEITPYHLPPVVVRNLAAGSTLPPSLPPRNSATFSPPTYTPTMPSRPRPASIAPSEGTLNTLTTDDDVFAVDGSSIARTLTTETASSTYTARQRRSNSPVAWGTSDPFADEPSSSSGAAIHDYRTATYSSTLANIQSAGLDPFADPANRPRPAFRRGPASERSVSTQARTEASFVPGDDTRALHLGNRWRNSLISTDGSSSSSFGNAAAPLSATPAAGGVDQTRIIHHLLDDDASSLGGHDNPPPAYTFVSDNTF